jgi:ATP-binding cassette, subfamily B, bacterial PglK
MNFYKSLLKLMTPKERGAFYLLQFLFLVTAALQVAGIASIAPFISMVSSPQIIENNLLIKNIYDFLSFGSINDFLMAYAVAVVILIFFGNSVSSFSLWLLFKFSILVGAGLQRRIYNNYIDNDFMFFAMNSSNRLVSVITQEIPRYVYMVLQPMLNLFAQSFVAVIIIFGLFYADPLIASLSVIIVCAIYAFIYLFVRKKVVIAGAVLMEVNQQKLTLLYESIAGIKEVKLLGNEEWYKAEVDKVTKKGLNSLAFIGMAGDLPKFIVETVVFSAILFFAIYLLSVHGPNGKALSILSLYAMAGYKILPAAQTIYKSISEIKANGILILELKDELDKSKPNADSKESISSNSNFEVGDIIMDNIYYRYPTAENNAISALTIKIPKFTVTSFVGGSGAGKSTTVDILLGLLEPTSGKLFVGDQEINRTNVRAWQKKIGYVPQSIFILDDSIKKNIAFGIPDDIIDHEKLEKSIKLSQLDQFIKRLPDGYNHKVGERGAMLSGGERQRIGIARALYKEPDIIIFDEATSALDTVTEERILKVIRALSFEKTIIMIAHRISTVVNSDQIFVFHNGKIVENGSFYELRDNSLYFKKLLNP